MTKKMNPEIKAQWISDLLSGEYPQGTYALNKDGKFCCLGVLCEQAVKAGVVERRDEFGEHGTIYFKDDEDASSALLPDAVMEWAGIDSSTGCIDEPGGVLSSMNDSGWNFRQIAKVIEEHF